MCGIFGYYRLKSGARVLNDFLPRTAEKLRHRGPDHEQIQRIDDRCTFGHTRLAIVGLEDKSSQPMNSEDLWVTYNGMIYNYLELRSRLVRLGSTFSSNSDTEVLVELLASHGLKALHELNGMFAFAAYRADSSELLLVRDRFGVKPLYFTVVGEVFYFCSELGPLIRIQPDLNRNVAVFNAYLKDTATDFGDQTPFEGISQVPAGGYLAVSNNSITSRKWYTLSMKSSGQTPSRRDGQWVDDVEDTLTDAIRLRLRADVPVALTLSGGIDSSLIYILARKRLGAELGVFSFSHGDSPSSEAASVQRLTSSFGDSVNWISSPAKETVQEAVDALGIAEGTEPSSLDSFC